jgi:hypothetical protein
MRLGAALLLLGLTGCGSGGSPSAPGSTSAPAAPPPSASPFPPRPAELKLDGVDPCALLTAAQQGQLGVQKVGQDNDSDDLGSAACQWGNNGGKPDNRWLARLIVKRGADYGTGSTTGIQIVQVEGFSAVQTSSPYGDPRTHCIVLVDVAQGQSLWAEYDNIAGDYPGINHDVACQLDRKAAELMVQNLRALAH